MEISSIFSDKSRVPNQADLAAILGETYKLWQQIEDYVMEKYPDGKKEWNYPGKKYGWSYRIKDKKRAILYFLPGEDTFKVAFVFGDKAVNTIVQSKINDTIKNELQSARKYAEGRGISFSANEDNLEDIKSLVEIKLKH